jgi:hypothetical protein
LKLGPNLAAICPLFVRVFDPQTGEPVWRHPALDQERERVRTVSEKRSLAGRKGAALSLGRDNATGRQSLERVILLPLLLSLPPRAKKMLGNTGL